MVKKNTEGVKGFKELLKTLEPYVKNFEKILKKESVPGFQLDPGEIWGNWLLCSVLRKNISGKITFKDQPKAEGDGIIIFPNGDEFQTEHVSATDNPFAPQKKPLGSKRIIQAIETKIKKNYSDADKIALVVFTDGAREWFRPEVRLAINGRHNFHRVFLVALLTNDQNGLAYSVTQLLEHDSITFRVQINPKFDHWSIIKMQ